MYKIILITLVTVVLFFSEAILHYSSGKKQKNEGFKVRFPEKKDIPEILTVLIFFSLLNTVITKLVDRFL